MSKRVKLLHLITGLPIGGAEKVLLDLTTHMDRDKIESFVIGLNHEDAMNGGFKEAGIYVKNLGMKRDIKGMYRSLKELSSFIKEKKIDIIHAHMFHPLVFAYLLRIINPKLKIVFTSHSENIGSKFREKITKLLKPFRDVDIIFSKQMKIDIYRDDALIIPNGVDIEKFTKGCEKNSRFTFISVGILREGKNHISLVKYAKELKSKGYDFEIWIVGSGDESGDERENIELAIKKADVEDRFKMLGSRDDIPELLCRADCFVMPSLYEGLPISILEAGAASKPVISTPVGAIPSLLGDECGYICDLNEFAKKMEYLLNNKEESKRYADNLNNLVKKRYSIQSMANSHEDIYLDLCRKD